MRRVRQLIAAALGAGGVLGVGAADTRLVLRHDGLCVVSESRIVPETNTSQTVLLEDIPAEADLSSLVLYSARFPLRARHWRRLGDAPAPAPREATLRVEGDGDVAWTPTRTARPPARRMRPRVAVDLEAESTGRREVELSYVMTGLTWKVDYVVTLRGDLTREEEKISVDLHGLLLVQNDTAKDFHDCSVRLVGVDAAAGGGPGRPAGLLMLDEDNPLSDLWLKPSVPPLHTYDYEIAARLSVAAHDRARVPVLAVERKPGTRVYAMRGEEFPTVGRDLAGAFTKWLELPNDPSVGLGRALPPGSAQILVAGPRPAMHQEAWFAHTPAGGRIRIDLGQSQLVRGERRRKGRAESAPGAVEETYQIQLQNRTAGPVEIEIDEVPPTALEWKVIRCNADYTVRGRRLLLRTTLKPTDLSAIEYTVRVNQPAL